MRLTSIVVSKRILCLMIAVRLLVLAGTASADLLIGWHSPSPVGQNKNDATPDVDNTGGAVSGVLGNDAGVYTSENGFEIRDIFDSTDGTFGTIAIPGSPATSNGFSLQTASTTDSQLDIKITNESTTNFLRLDTLHFDYARAFAAGPTNLSVYRLGTSDLDFPADDEFYSIYSTDATFTLGAGAGDYADVDADLARVFGTATRVDNTLAPGESAAYRFEVTNAAGISSSLGIDNVAVSGELFSPNLLVGWHTPDNDGDGNDVTPDLAVSGVAGTVYGVNAHFENTAIASTDGSYGSVPASTPGYDGDPGNGVDAWGLTDEDNAKNYIDVEISRSAGAPLNLDYMHFDFHRLFAGSPTNLVVTYLYGDLGATNGTPLFTSIGSTELGLQADGRDVDLELDDLLGGDENTVLARGGSATFRFYVDDSGNASKFAIDNIAFSGSILPPVGFVFVVK
jgi:hypothetical protein